MGRLNREEKAKSLLKRAKEERRNPLSLENIDDNIEKLTKQKRRFSVRLDDEKNKSVKKELLDQLKVVGIIQEKMMEEKEITRTALFHNFAKNIHKIPIPEIPLEYFNDQEIQKTIPITKLENLSTRLEKFFKEKKIITIADLISFYENHNGDEGFLSENGFGKKTLSEIQEIVRRYKIKMPELGTSTTTNEERWGREKKITKQEAQEEEIQHFLKGKRFDQIKINSDFFGEKILHAFEKLGIKTVADFIKFYTENNGMVGFSKQGDLGIRSFYYIKTFFGKELGLKLTAHQPIYEDTQKIEDTYLSPEVKEKLIKREIFTAQDLHKKYRRSYYGDPIKIEINQFFINQGRCQHWWDNML